MFTPATFHRAEAGGTGLWSLTERVRIGIFLFIKLKALYCLAAALLVVRLTDKTGWRQRTAAFCRQNIIVLAAMVLSLGVVFMSGFSYNRIGAGTGFYAIILLLTIAKPDTLLWRRAKIAVCVVACCVFCCMTWYTIKVRAEHRHLLERVMTAETNAIPCHSVAMPDWMLQYVSRPVRMNRFKPDAYIAAAYGKAPLTFVPDMIWNDIACNSPRLHDIALQGDYPYYVIPLEEGAEDAKPVFVFNPVDFGSLPFYVRPFAGRLGRYTVNELPCYNYGVLSIGGRPYLFISKHDLLDCRLNSIVLRGA